MAFNRACLYKWLESYGAGPANKMEVLNIRTDYVASCSVFQRIIGTGVKATGAGKAVGLEGLSPKNPLGGARGTGPPTFSAIKAGILVDPDFKDA